MIKSFIKLCIYFCAAVGFLFFVFLTISAYHKISSYRFLNAQNKVIIVNLNEEFPEKAKNGLLNSFIYGAQTSFSSLLLALKRAEEDPSVKTLLVIGNNSSLGLAQTQELRAAVLRLKKAGKKTIFWAEDTSLKEYYLASVFEERISPESGEMSLTGLRLGMPFVKEGLEKFGIQPQFYGKFEYKSAIASLTEEEMPEPVKRNMEEVLSNLFRTLVYETETVLKKQEGYVSSFEELINDAPFSAQEGLEKKLLTRLAYYEDIIDEETEKNLIPVPVSVYSSLPSSILRATFNPERTVPTVSDLWRRRGQLLLLRKLQPRVKTALSKLSCCALTRAVVPTRRRTPYAIRCSKQKKKSLLSVLSAIPELPALISLHRPVPLFWRTHFL